MIKCFVVLCFAIFSGIFSKTIAQEKPIVKKHEIDIVKVYERVVADGYVDAFIYKKLATEYYSRSDFANSKKYFEKLFKLQKIKDSEIELKYNNCLKALSDLNQNIALLKLKA